MTEHHEPRTEPATTVERRRGPFCSNCGYDLALTAAGGRCPECGSDVSQMLGAKATSGYATASLVLGIVSLLTGCVTLVTAPLAIVFGVKARRQVARGEADRSSRSLATAGLVCGIVALVIWLGILLFYAALIVAIP